MYIIILDLYVIGPINYYIKLNDIRPILYYITLHYITLHYIIV